jgi:type III restriction enzyme
LARTEIDALTRSAISSRSHWAIAAIIVMNNVYDTVMYDSEVEREFAGKLDKRQDIQLFVMLPDRFKIETSLGTYNPDRAIVKHDDTVLYFGRETEGTKNFEKLRSVEAE